MKQRAPSGEKLRITACCRQPALLFNLLFRLACRRQHANRYTQALKTLILNLNFRQ